MSANSSVHVTLSPHDARRIAVAAAVHPRTVLRAYRGDTVRSTCAARIAHAATLLGLPRFDSDTGREVAGEQRRSGSYAGLPPSSAEVP